MIKGCDKYIVQLKQVHDDEKTGGKGGSKSTRAREVGKTDLSLLAHANPGMTDMMARNEGHDTPAR